MVLMQRLARWFPLAVLILLLLGHSVALYVWLKAHVLPNGYQNEIFHLGNALDLYNAFRGRDWRLVHDLLFTQYWPPLQYLASFPLLAFELSRDSFVLSNLAFLALLVWAVYRIGTRLESPAAGVLAAVLVSFFPSIYGNLRHFEPNVPLTAMVAASLWWLLLSHRFAHRGYSVWFGFFAGLTLLVDRISGAFFLFIPAGFEFLMALYADRRWQKARAQRALINALLALGMCLLVCGYFYVNFFRFYSEEILPQAVQGEILSTGEQSEFRPPLAITTLLFYPNTLLDSQVGFGLGLLLLLPLLLVVWKGGRLRLMWLWLLSPVVLFTLIQKKQLYYTIPILPAFAILASIGLLRLGMGTGMMTGAQRTGRDWISFVLSLGWGMGILGVAFHQFMLTSFGQPILPERVVLPVKPILLDLSWLGGRSRFPPDWVSPRYPQSWPPVTDDLQVDEILTSLRQVKSVFPTLRVETFSEDSFFFEGYLTFFVRCAHPDAIVNGLIQNPQGFYENLRLMDAFVYVTPSKRAFPTEESIREIVRMRGQFKDFENLPIVSVLLSQENKLEALSHHVLGNGSTAHVYGLKPWSALPNPPSTPALTPQEPVPATPEIPSSPTPAPTPLLTRPQ